MSNTPSCGWNRAFAKHSPTTDCKFSPLVPIQGKVRPSIQDDNALINALWGLITQEEYYYQNFIGLISLHKLNPLKTSRILNVNRLPSLWSKRLINFHALGQGSFGRIYKASDTLTDMHYALKEVTSYDKNSGHLLKNTVMIMTERNAHFRANDSPFIVKLYGAFQDPKLRSYWLIFEYCIGDLAMYINYIRLDVETYFDKLLEKNVLKPLYKIFNESMNLDVEKIGCVYAFELLAGIDYLAKRNLLHNDLKPNNVLVSTRGHLKISDLGLTHRFRWLDRSTSVEFSDPSFYKTYEMRDKKLPFYGNLKYTDPEVLIFFDTFYPAADIYNRIKHPKFPLKDIYQDFLTDLYSVALIIVDLLFAGMNILVTSHLSLRIMNRFDVNRHSERNIAIWPIRCMYDNVVHKEFLLKILENQTSSKNESLIDFLKTCFLPRSERAYAYTKPFRHMKLKEVVLTRCINLEKIKEIEYYKHRGITEYNVTTMEMPESFKNIFKSQITPLKAKTFMDLLNVIENRCNADEQEIPMVPFQFTL